MADYEITAPDGRRFRVSGPGTKEEALARVQAQYQAPRERQFVGPVANGADMIRAQPQQPKLGVVQGLGQAAKGFADVGISSARGLVNKPAGTLAGIVGVVNPNDTYLGAQQRFRQAVEGGETIVGDERLRTPQGEMVATSLASAMNAPVVGGMPNPLPLINRGFELIGNKFGPEVRDVAESGAMLATLRSPRGLSGYPRSAITPESVVARSAGQDSVGAAAAATNVAQAGPQLRQAIVQTGGRSGRINNEVLARHMEADTLPVPIRLTQGEATQDPIAISLERNLRGKHPQMVERMHETNRALGQNMQALRDQVGPQVFSTNPVEHGDTLISAYRRLDAVAEGEVNRLYGELRGALGSRVPVDADKILKSATNELHERLLYDHAPPAEMATLTRLAQSRNMTFENFEALRTNLARIMRSGADGNVKAAAGVIRNALEELPLMPGSGAERMKPIADAARAAARRRFQAIEADPAYDAAINGTVPPDRFVQKFVIGGTRDNLDLMLRTLGNDPSVRQTVSVATLDHLRDAARLNPAYEGNFSSAGFSRALQGLGAKANIIFDARTAETLGNLNNVARYTTAQPRGSFVNNSNTLVASAAKYGADAAEGMTNYAFMGLPVGTGIRRGIEALGTRRTINNALQPGAGLRRPRNSLARRP